jgi:hypothetical protein
VAKAIFYSLALPTIYDNLKLAMARILGDGLVLLERKIAALDQAATIARLNRNERRVVVSDAGLISITQCQRRGTFRC